MDLNAMLDDIPDDMIPAALMHPMNNMTRLKLLNREITYIVKHHIQPMDDWYEERSQYIYSYMEIDWLSVEKRFHQKDNTMHLSAANITALLHILVDELSTSVRFSLIRYYKLLDEIYHIWTYYKSTYVGEEQDENVVDLIETMTHL